MLTAMGTPDSERSTMSTFSSLIDDEPWVLLGCVTPDARLVGYAAAQYYGPHLRNGQLHRTARLHDLFVVERDRREVLDGS